MIYDMIIFMYNYNSFVMCNVFLICFHEYLFYSIINPIFIIYFQWSSCHIILTLEPEEDDGAGFGDLFG